MLAAPAALRLYENEVELSQRALGLISARVVSKQRIRYDQIAQVVINNPGWGVLGTHRREHWRTHHAYVSSAGSRRPRGSRCHRRGDELARSSTAAASSSTASIATQIRELSELRDVGITTEAACETKKKELLDRM